MVLSFTGGRGGQILERGEFISDELGGFGKCQSPSLTCRKTPRGRQDLPEQTSSKQGSGQVEVLGLGDTRRKSEEKFELRDYGTSILLLTSHKENRYE